MIKQIFINKNFNEIVLKNSDFIFKFLLKYFDFFSEYNLYKIIAL
jgi:hypothetical protein